MEILKVVGLLFGLTLSVSSLLLYTGNVVKFLASAVRGKDAELNIVGSTIAITLGLFLLKLCW